MNLEDCLKKVEEAINNLKEVHSLKQVGKDYYMHNIIEIIRYYKYIRKNDKELNIFQDATEKISDLALENELFRRIGGGILGIPELPKIEEELDNLISDFNTNRKYDNDSLEEVLEKLEKYNNTLDSYSQYFSKGEISRIEEKISSLKNKVFQIEEVLDSTVGKTNGF